MYCLRKQGRNYNGAIIDVHIIIYIFKFIGYLRTPATAPTAALSAASALRHARGSGSTRALTGRGQRPTTALSVARASPVVRASSYTPAPTRGSGLMAAGAYIIS